MAFKLYSDQLTDLPYLACDVCGQRIVDVWSDKASGSPTNDGKISEVVVHHAACKAPGALQIPLINFLRLFVIGNRIGNVGSDGKTDRLIVEYPTGKGFEK